MDLDEYYFQSKNHKQRKFEGCSRRKGKTLRAEQARSQKRFCETVRREIHASGYWSTDRINEFCRDVLEEGGIDTESPSGEFSMNKKNRWDLNQRVRNAVFRNSHDPELPNVSIVEKVANRNGCNKDTVTRTTHSVTIPAKNGKKQSVEQTRLVVDEKSKSMYSRENDLAEKHGICSKRQRGSESKDHAEVSYVFEYSCPDERYPRDHYKDLGGKMISGKKKNHLLELYDFRHGESWQYCSLDEDFEDEGVEDGDDYFQRQSEDNFTLDLGLEIVSAISKRDQKSSKCKTKKKYVNSASTHKSKKGQVIELSQSQRTCDNNERLKSQSRKTTVFKISQQCVQTYISERQFNNSVNVCVSNSVPVAFAVDVRPKQCDEAKNECYLLFETDYNSEIFCSPDEESSASENCNVEVSLFCADQELVEMTLTGFKSFPTLEDGITVEDIIASCNKSIRDVLAHRVTHHHAIRQKPVSERLTSISNDLSKTLGMELHHYPTIQCLRNSRDFQDNDPDADFEFELVVDSSPAEKCQLCGVDFDKSRFSGMSLKDCRHWFCMVCWLKEFTQKREFLIHCPEPGCTSIANLVTKMIIISRGGFPTNELNCGRIGTDMAYRCPSSSCHSFVKTDKSSGIPSLLSCACGTAWCGQCGHEPHWPASCSAAEKQNVECAEVRMKRFTTRKQCIMCGHYVLEGHYVCQNCDYRFQCRQCMRADNKTWPEGCVWWYCQGKKVPEKRFVILSDDSVVEAADVLPSFEYVSRYLETALNVESNTKVRENATGSLKHDSEEVSSVVADLLSVKNQLSYTIPWVFAELRHGRIKKSQLTRYLRGLLKKLENRLKEIELLLARTSLEEVVYLKAYQQNANKGRGLLKQIRDAFDNHQ